MNEADTCRMAVRPKLEAVGWHVGSMCEFKQIIGRGTRVRDDHGKLYFTILDYTGSATRMFADPEFDGEPSLATQEQIDDKGDTVEGTEEVVQPEETLKDEGTEKVAPVEPDFGDEVVSPRKFYVDDGQIEIAADLVYELDAGGKKLRVVKYTEYTADSVQSLFPSAAELWRKWSDPHERSAIIAAFEDRGVDFDEVAKAADQPEADPFDLLRHLAYNAPLRTRRERADRLLEDKTDFSDQYVPDASAVLQELLAKYEEFGTAQFVLPDALEVPPISEHGNVVEIAKLFGGSEQLVEAVKQLQSLLYAA